MVTNQTTNLTELSIPKGIATSIMDTYTRLIGAVIGASFTAINLAIPYDSLARLNFTATPGACAFSGFRHGLPQFNCFGLVGSDDQIHYVKFRKVDQVCPATPNNRLHTGPITFGEQTRSDNFPVDHLKAKIESRYTELVHARR
jgi:hypothetical protein